MISETVGGRLREMAGFAEVHREVLHLSPARPGSVAAARPGAGRGVLDLPGLRTRRLRETYLRARRGLVTDRGWG